MRKVYPQPGFSEQDVLDALNSDSMLFADTFVIIPLNGDPILYTNFQTDVEVASITIGSGVPVFTSKLVNIEGLRMVASVGIQVDEQDIVLRYPPALDAYQGRLPWAKALLAGELDGAIIARDRYVKTRPETPWVGGWSMFRGLVSSISDVGRSSANIRVKSNLILLDTQMPRDLYEPGCKNTWGDFACGVNQEDFMATGTVESGSTRSTLRWSGAESGYSLGKVHITAEDGITRVRTILRADDSNLYLAYPLDFTPVVGQSFDAFLGCDRTSDRCAFFHGDPGWKSRFKGFPFVPVAESAIGVGIGAT